MGQQLPRASSTCENFAQTLVKWFMPMKGYSFLEPDDVSPDVFCHLGTVEASGQETLPQGAVVSCEFVQSDRGFPGVENPARGDANSRGPVETRVRHFDTRYPDPQAGTDLAPALGTVKFYDPARGLGFVMPDARGHEVFVHANVPRGLQATDIESVRANRYRQHRPAET